MEGLIIYTGCLNNNQIVWGWRVGVGWVCRLWNTTLNPHAQSSQINGQRGNYDARKGLCEL